MQNISEGLYGQKSFHVDLQSGEQMQQFYLLNAFVFWKGSNMCHRIKMWKENAENVCPVFTSVGMLST